MGCNKGAQRGGGRHIHGGKYVGICGKPLQPSGAQQMQEMSHKLAHDNDCLSMEDVKSAIKHMNYGTTCDPRGLYAEMLK